MPSLGVLDTRLVPDRSIRRLAPGRILSAVAALLIALPLWGVPGAQEPAAREAGAQDAPSPQDAAAMAKWARLTSFLVSAYTARHPDRALELAWPEAQTLVLGKHGSSATLVWREALRDGLTRLSSFDSRSLARADLARLKALGDWLEAELLLLDSLSPSTTSPSSYVLRALRTLRAADEALWVPPEERRKLVASMLGELPDYFRDARISLVAPSPLAIDLGLEDLADLNQIVRRLEAENLPKSAPAGSSPPARSGKKTSPPTPPPPHAALDGFQRWLLELRPSAGGLSPRLDAGEWQRLVDLSSGRPWEPGEVKVRCLRELARLDLPSLPEPGRSRKKAPATEGLVSRTWTASEYVLDLGKRAGLLDATLAADSLQFALEESLRTDTRSVELRSGLQALCGHLELSHSAWSPTRAVYRNRAIMGAQQTALGVRHGLVGEALIERSRRGTPDTLQLLLDNRLVLEGFGLFAQDWVMRVDWVDNTLRSDEELTRALAWQRGVEAARLVAALELHAEGLSLDEASQAFQRRTGADPETAMAESLAAQRDPLHGIGFLGLLEFEALERRMVEATAPRRGLKLAVQLPQRHPELRPADLTLGLLADLPRVR